MKDTKIPCTGTMLPISQAKLDKTIDTEVVQGV